MQQLRVVADRVGGGGNMGDFNNGGWGEGLQRWGNSIRGLWEEVGGGFQYLEYKLKYNNTYI